MLAQKRLYSSSSTVSTSSLTPRKKIQKVAKRRVLLELPSRLALVTQTSRTATIALPSYVTPPRAKMALMAKVFRSNVTLPAKFEVFEDQCEYRPTGAKLFNSPGENKENVPPGALLKA